MTAAERVDDGQSAQLRPGSQLTVHEDHTQVSFERVAGRRSSRNFALTRRLGILSRKLRRLNFVLRVITSGTTCVH